MWPFFVVFASPGIQNNLRLAKRSKYLTVQEFVTQLVVKAFDVCVLPRRARLDVEDRDLEDP